MAVSEELCLWRSESVNQSSLTLCNPMDWSPPGSSVRGILQASILEQDKYTTDIPNEKQHCLTHVPATRCVIIGQCSKVMLRTEDLLHFRAMTLRNAALLHLCCHCWNSLQDLELVLLNVLRDDKSISLRPRSTLVQKTGWQDVWSEQSVGWLTSGILCRCRWKTHIQSSWNDIIPKRILYWNSLILLFV